MLSVKEYWDNLKKERELLAISNLSKAEFCTEVVRNTEKLSGVAFNTEEEKNTVNKINSFLSKYTAQRPSFAALWLPQYKPKKDSDSNTLSTGDPIDHNVTFVGVVGIIQSISKIINAIKKNSFSWNSFSWNNKRLKYCNRLLRLFFFYALDNIIYTESTDFDDEQQRKIVYMAALYQNTVGIIKTELNQTDINMLYSVMTQAHSLVIGSRGGQNNIRRAGVKSKKRNNKKSKSRKSRSTKRR